MDAARAGRVLRGRGEQGGVHVSNKARIFKVLKTPVPLERTAAGAARPLGYEFFKVDPETGRSRELDEVFGPDAQRDFWLEARRPGARHVHLLERWSRRRAGGRDACRPRQSAAGRRERACFWP